MYKQHISSRLNRSLKTLQTGIHCKGRPRNLSLFSANLQSIHRDIGPHEIFRLQQIIKPINKFFNIHTLV